MARYGQKGRKKKKGRRKKGQPTGQGRLQKQNKTVGEDWIRLEVRATLLEDAHLGSGAGGAGIDALVARDRDGRPVIWASHLKGLLRDAARRVRDTTTADNLFGRRGGQKQRLLLTSLYASSSPASRIWRSTARNSFENRAPRDDTLRVLEYVPKGTRFAGAVELRKHDREVFQRLVLEVDAVGRGRATGAGRVRLTLSEAPMKQCVAGRAKDRLRLLLRNLEPLCITATATPDNLVPSMSFVPGRSMLGALAAWLIAEGDREAAALLTSARVSVSDALPLPEVPQRLADIEVLPAPLTLQREKSAGARGPIPWWAQSEKPPRRLDAWRVSREADGGTVKLKRPEPDLFVYRSSKDARWQTYRPLTRVRLRNGRSNPNQVDPDLFAVEQIAERTVFVCEIAGAREFMKRLTRALAPVLEGRRWLRVGRGGVPVEVTRVAWAERLKPVEEPLEQGYMILTSDLLVRDERLRWLGSMNDSAFQKFPRWPSDVRISGTLQESVPVYGFNGTARLRRLPALAVRRGSVYQVKGTGVDKLVELIRQGKWLGERTHEGFGHFALYPIEALPGVGDVDARPVQAIADDPAEAAAEATRRWFEAHRVLAQVEKKDRKGQRPPSLSQWNDLVSDLQRGNLAALESRQNPNTSGARTWEHVDAKEVLNKLDALPPPRRIEHARMFVQWLRAEMKNNSRKAEWRQTP